MELLTKCCFANLHTLYSVHSSAKPPHIAAFTREFEFVNSSESVGIPFLISGNGYGIIHNMLCQTAVALKEDIVWRADCVKDLSFKK